jgi:transcriptional regulator with XRE-family HTH domain
MDTPGKRLKYFRTYNKLTQKKLAEILDMEWYQIKDMEAGKVNISKQIAKLLCYETGINYKWLLTGEGEMELKIEKGHKEQKETDLEEKMKQFEARIVLLERILSQSSPEPGRRWYDPAIQKKK